MEDVNKNVYQANIFLYNKRDAKIVHLAVSNVSLIVVAFNANQISYLQMGYVNYYVSIRVLIVDKINAYLV